LSVASTGKRPHSRRNRVGNFPGLTGSRLLREIKERGYGGGYTAVTDFLREIRPATPSSFEGRFETPPGAQAQVDFAQFQVVITDEPTAPCIVWLFSLALGYSRLIWARSSCIRTSPLSCAVMWPPLRRWPWPH